MWERVDDLIGDGRLLISEEVWVESQVRDAPVRAWCTPRKDMIVVATDAAIAARVTDIVTEFHGWAVGQRNRADPFVVAVALQRSATVVTGERGGTIRRPKIPFVCDRRSVPHVEFLDVIRQEGWSF